MSELAETAETIVIDYELDEAPGQVWRALTEPELLAAWLGPNDIRPEVGRQFQIAAGAETGDAPVQCQVLAVEPQRSISYSWRDESRDGAGVDSRVTWTLTPTFVGGTHLRLVHEGFVLTSGAALAMAGRGRGISTALAMRVGGMLAAAFRLAA